MKVCCVGLALLVIGGASAQAGEMGQGFSVRGKESPLVAPVSGGVGGVAGKAVKLGPKAWELVSPLAPASMGYGRGMVVLNSQGKPKGFILVSVPVW